MFVLIILYYYYIFPVQSLVCSTYTQKKIKIIIEIILKLYTKILCFKKTIFEPFINTVNAIIVSVIDMIK